MPNPLRSAWLAFRRRRLYRRCLSAPTRAFVLRYHSVGDPARVAEYLDPGLSVTPERFAAQIGALARRCTFGDPAELPALVAGGGTLAARDGRPRVYLTFDDGYRDNHDVVLPILREHGARAAFYITTAPLSGRFFWISELWRLVPRLPDGPLDLGPGAPDHVPADPEARRLYRRTLTRAFSSLTECARETAIDALAQRAGVPRGEGLEGTFLDGPRLRAMADAGMTIGAHTRTHPHLDRLAPADHAEEVQGSRADLEAILGRPVEHFAYPNPSGGGAVSATARESAAAARFATAMTSIANPLDATADLLRLPRMGVYAGDQERLLFRLIERSVA